eukprot:gnl/TRDRNA2_/TRDRNA2_174892_c3_seq6.p1 gnl/TRDRNA2_/TRDRNA2_174892_c3~~gnl/TRDRNA2_/TRDRNA2_174892_c3_seq6.p1  ORF type:complete len:237 (+),score=41.03 gnl/TRDRNA2_/TRDRNA2_174892_c3_seq6:122-832(+)
MAVLDTLDARGVKPQENHYTMLMRCVAATGQIVQGFAMLKHVEVSGLLSHPRDGCYTIFRVLIDSCRAFDDANGASRVQAMVDRLGLTALTPVAVTVVQGSERRYENGIIGEGVEDARKLWFELRQQTTYIPQLRSLPWAFMQHSSLEQQEASLQLHAEKKALATLLARGEGQLKVSINFNACMDCHEFFKSASLWLERSIELSQPKLMHTFADGRCSCMDRWRWEAQVNKQSSDT